MFNTITVAAKSVRPGDIIKVAGTKYEIESVTSYHNSDDIELAFKPSSDLIRFSTFLVNKNDAIKIYQK
jgi:hypothetical protein